MLLALLLLAGAALFYWIERAGDGQALNTAYAGAAVLLLLYLKRFYHDQRAVLLTGFYQLYSSVGMLLSATLIANGVYMLEIRHYGTANGTFWVVLFYLIIGLETSVLGFRSGRKLHLGWTSGSIAARPTRIISSIFVGSALLGAALVLARYGGPMLQGVDRVTFWKKIVPSEIGFVRTLLLQSFFFAAYYYLITKKHKINIIIPSILIMIYLAFTVVVLGEKLSAFILYATIWLILVAAIFPDFRLRRAHIIMLFAVVVALIVGVVLTYVASGYDTLFALARIALQAQLLWSVLSDANVPNLIPSNMSCYFGCNGLPRGIDFISQRYLPQSVFSFYNETGSQLSGFFPALAILTFGSVLTIVADIFTTFVMGIMQYKMIYAINIYGPIVGFLYFKIVTSLGLIWFAASLSAVPGIIVVALLIICYHLIFANWAQRKPAYQPVSRPA